jgi:hypothetical protein
MDQLQFYKTHISEDEKFPISKWVEYEIRKKFSLYNTQNKKRITATNYDGWVYVISFKDHFKIGYSSHPVDRVSQYASKPPFDITLHGLFYFPKIARAIESSCHDLFDKYRRRGEWFFDGHAIGYEVALALSKISNYQTPVSLYKIFHSKGLNLGTCRGTEYHHEFLSEKCHSIRQQGLSNITHSLFFRRTH